MGIFKSARLALFADPPELSEPMARLLKKFRV